MKPEAITRAFDQTKIILRNVYSFSNVDEYNEEYVTRMATLELNGLRLVKGFRVKKLLKDMDQECLDIFVALIEWREILAKVVDEKPKYVIDARRMLEVSSLKHCYNMEKIRDIVVGDGNCHNIYLFKSMKEPRQVRVIQKIVESKGQYMKHLRKLECFNCFYVGHGPAWACPFPKNNQNYALWMNRKENVRFKMKQNQRRFENLVKKCGEERAKLIMSAKRVVVGVYKK